eukprot:TRINITY_DN12522_c0_g1_i1.p1 TRINITY_DN12522_c0_g1~~TRINITY_DN12522_c0_g1_i1.p1  ORF type:complete len:1270 (+),score=392.35 TRINITY_DN12522_c0_g1_i1:62-3811(+)
MPFPVAPSGHAPSGSGFVTHAQRLLQRHEELASRLEAERARHSSSMSYTFAESGVAADPGSPPSVAESFNRAVDALQRARQSREERKTLSPPRPPRWRVPERIGSGAVPANAEGAGDGEEAREDAHPSTEPLQWPGDRWRPDGERVDEPWQRTAAPEEEERQQPSPGDARWLQRAPPSEDPPSAAQPAPEEEDRLERLSGDSVDGRWRQQHQPAREEEPPERARRVDGEPRRREDPPEPRLPPTQPLLWPGDDSGVIRGGGAVEVPTQAASSCGGSRRSDGRPAAAAGDAPYTVSSFSYTREALRKRKAEAARRSADANRVLLAAASSSSTDGEPARARPARKEVGSVASRGTSQRSWSPPRNRHRVRRDDESFARTPPPRRAARPVRSRTPQQRRSPPAPRYRTPTPHSVYAGDDVPVLVPLPRFLAASCGSDPALYRVAAEAHAPALVHHLCSWLHPPSEEGGWQAAEDAVCLLALLPALRELPRHAAAMLLPGLAALLERFSAIASPVMRDGVLYVLRCAAAAFPEGGVQLLARCRDVLLDLMRFPRFSRHLPSFVKTVLAIGVPGGVSRLVDLADRLGPPSDSLSQHALLVLSLVANHPVVLEQVVLPWMVTDLRRTDAPEVSAAACCAVAGLPEGLRGRCAAPVGDAFVSGCFDRRTAAVCARMCSAGDAVRFFQAMLRRRRSPRVRRAAVYALSLYADAPGRVGAAALAGSRSRPTCTVIVRAAADGRTGHRLTPLVYCQPQPAESGSSYSVTHAVADAAAFTDALRQAVASGRLRGACVGAPTADSGCSATPGDGGRGAFAEAARAVCTGDVASEVRAASTFVASLDGMGCAVAAELKEAGGAAAAQDAVGPPPKSASAAAAAALRECAMGRGSGADDALRAAALDALCSFEVRHADRFTADLLCMAADGEEDSESQPAALRFLGWVRSSLGRSWAGASAAAEVLRACVSTEPAAHLSSITAACDALRQPPLRPCAGTLGPLLSLFRGGVVERDTVAGAIAAQGPKGCGALCDAALATLLPISVRRAAAKALGGVGGSASEVPSAARHRAGVVLCELTKDKEPQLREQALLSLAQDSGLTAAASLPPTRAPNSAPLPPSDPLLRIFTAAASDADARVSRAACCVLAMSGQCGERELLAALVRSGGSRVSACCALPYLQSPATALRAALPCLHDVDGEVREAGAKVVAALPLPETAEALRSLPAAKIADTRLAMQEALSKAKRLRLPAASLLRGVLAATEPRS